MKKALLLLTLLSYTLICAAQKKPIILKSNANLVSIKEGKSFYKAIWGVTADVKPDIFRTNTFTGKQKIVFQSDIDSIVFEVKPNQKYDFVILLNGRDSAYTQINTFGNGKPSLKPKLYYTHIKPIHNLGNDTIPFRIGTDNRIHISGSINNSDTLDLIYDTGAGICVITSSLISENKVKVNIDGTAQNNGTDGTSTVQTSGNNKITIGNLIWNKASLLSIDYKPKSNFPFDAVLGWLVFEDKVVEINYETQNIILHNSLPQLTAEYSKLEFKLINGIHYIKCKLVVNGKESETWFDFDTGANGELSIGKNFATANNLNNAMKKIGTSLSKGSSGIEIKNTQVLLPKLKIGDFEMYQIPLSIPDQDPTGVEIKGNIGNNLLKRFNVVMDFKNETIYLTPNRLFYSKM